MKRITAKSQANHLVKILKRDCEGDWIADTIKTNNEFVPIAFCCGVSVMKKESTYFCHVDLSNQKMCQEIKGHIGTNPSELVRYSVSVEREKLMRGIRGLTKVFGNITYAI